VRKPLHVGSAKKGLLMGRGGVQRCDRCHQPGTNNEGKRIEGKSKKLRDAKEKKINWEVTPYDVRFKKHHPPHVKNLPLWP